MVLLLIAGCGGSGSGSSTGGGGGQSNTPTTVTFTFQGATPTAVAASIGAGAYAAETLNGKTLTLSIPSGTTKFAVAYVCPPIVYTVGGVGESQTQEETVFEATTTDGTSFSRICSSSTPTGQEGLLTGSVDANAIAGASLMVIQAANSSVFWQDGLTVDTPATNINFSLPTGNYRVMVGVMSSPSSTEESGLLAARDFDSQTVPGALNAGDTVVLGAADETTSQTITYNNVPSGFSAPTTLASFDFGGGGDLLIAVGATNQYPVLPVAATENGDYYLFEATSLTSGYPIQGVETFQASSTAGPVTLNFPAPWSYAGPAAAALPTFDMDYSGFAGQAGVYDSVLLWWGNGITNVNYINLMTTASYQNGSTTLAEPDLSGLSGFLAAPSSGTEVDWTGIITQSSAKMGQIAPSNTSGSAVLVQGGYLEP